jgi:uncharacterized protein (TIGR02996 family)
VTEDEVFIRAIVASPGDDTPRLVYADWLDEHDDPRGTYLRAETEWAKPWRVGERPGESSELRKLAKELDLVWVARVSRPPSGVCCDHLRFTDSGSPITMQQLDTLENNSFAREAKYGGYPEPVFLGLPVDYRAFMLNQNGGECSRSSFPVPSTEEQPAYVAEACFRFWRFGETIPLDDPTGPWGSWLFAATYRPVNSPSPNPDVLLLRLDGEKAGRVYFLARSRFQDWELDELPEVARSLSEFFAILIPLNCGSINPSTQHI